MTKFLVMVIMAAASVLNNYAADTWLTVWAGSVHGPYPSGNAVAQPDLQNVFPGAQANDQNVRLVIGPAFWSGRMRLRFSNVFGSKPLTLVDVYAGVHASGGRLMAGTNRPVHFSGRTSITIKPGTFVWSDPVDLDYARKTPAAWGDRKMAVSFHVAGDSGPMTWHAKAMQTSYLSPPHSGSRGAEESSDAFPFTTTSWYFLDAVDAAAPPHAKLIVAFGDSLTDGTNSTINGDDRWPDFLAARLRSAGTAPVAVVNAGIGGNQVAAPAHYDPAKPIGGGPSALERLDRDVLGLSGVSTVIWLEGINDLGTSGASAEDVIAGMREGIARLHAQGIRVIGATIVTSLNSTPTHGTPLVNEHRKIVNEFIRHGGAFDAVADFDAATVDATSGALREEFRPSSSTGGPGDGLHPNRAGYQAMAASIPLQSIF